MACVLKPSAITVSAHRMSTLPWNELTFCSSSNFTTSTASRVLIWSPYYSASDQLSGQCTFSGFRLPLFVFVDLELIVVLRDLIRHVCSVVCSLLPRPIVYGILIGGSGFGQPPPKRPVVGVVKAFASIRNRPGVQNARQLKILEF
jgi:hypothetical protein